MTTIFPHNYGYVFAVMGGSFFMNTYLAMNVVSARKKYNVQYPNLYAPPSNPNADAFNCIQRAHQNTLESYSVVMLQMFACGLVYPVTSAVCGGLWVLGRFLYGYGYSKFGAQGRMFGGIFSHLGDIPLVVLCFKIAYDLTVKK
eukprot:CAMPEP_0113719030 /NCGR_PEP_ID=MMETSP0038_2-20120614/35556_1 /TAXON_ID=2898 /ORGANISM="Cryptomonas paramecium" /LENGTH=143 /DNA_ID=CAMNT_0000647293 /DNA_START=19 /DNA_END=450 /DNA_ORIENTATION=- /assembly_acc=CAM_ASM_000170